LADSLGRDGDQMHPVTRWQRGHGEAQIDRQPALPLGGERVWIDAGEGAYQGGLSVVDVACRAEHRHGVSGPVPEAVVVRLPAFMPACGRAAGPAQP
jgi:hypothetical protein